MCTHELGHDLAEPIGLGCGSVARFCHDVLSPLTVIKEYASIIADRLGGPVSPKQEEYLATIIKATQKVKRMVDELYQQHAAHKERCGGQ